MHRNVLGSVALSALLLGTGAANAADLTYEAPPIEEAAPAFSWSGFYAGVHGGYAWGSQDNDHHQLLLDGSVDLTFDDEFSVDGFLGGIHAGHNWQSGSFVYGVEGDVDVTGLKGSAGYTGYFDGTGIYPDGNLELKSQWQASARLRAGYAMDRTFIYGTGGIAFADGKLTSSGTNFDGGARFSSDDRNTHVGWTVGVGIEHALTEKWLARAEFRYTDFGSKTYELFEGPVDVSWSQSAILAGLSRKF